MWHNLFRPIKTIANLYSNGFKSMCKQSSTLWIIASVKILIMFLVLKTFFFKDFLKTNFKTDKQRIEYINKQLTKSNHN
jgi:hypothetical protein